MNDIVIIYSNKINTIFAFNILSTNEAPLISFFDMTWVSYLVPALTQCHLLMITQKTSID